METVKAKSVRVLVIHAERDNSYGRYGHIKGCVSHESNREEGWDGQRYDGDGDILDVVINSQCDDGGSGMYAMEVASEVHRSITCREAAKIVKLLAPIERKLTKMYETEGNPVSMGAFVNRVARAIGASCVITFSKERKEKTGNGYRRHTLGESVYVVDCMAREVLDWCAEGKKAA